MSLKQKQAKKDAGIDDKVKHPKKYMKNCFFLPCKKKKAVSEAMGPHGLWSVTQGMEESTGSTVVAHQ